MKNVCLSLLLVCAAILFIPVDGFAATYESYSNIRIGAGAQYVGTTTVSKVTTRAQQQTAYNTDACCTTVADGVPVPYSLQIFYRSGSYKQEATSRVFANSFSSVSATYYRNFGNLGETYSLGLWNPHREMISVSGEWTPN